MATGKTYLGLVFGLLGGSVLSIVALVWAAKAEAGLGIEDDYYGKAVRFDQEAAEKARSRALGIQVRAGLWAIDGDRLGVGLTFLGPDGMSASDLEPQVEAFRIARSGVPFAPALARTDEGEFRGEISPFHCGLWELRIRATRGNDVFVDRVRLEVPCGARRAP